MHRKLLIIGAAVAAVLVVVALALPLLVDVDRFRPVIQNEMRAALGREVRIGKLRFSWLAGGIAAEEISIADDPAFSREPFVRAKSLHVGVDLMPLIFSRSLHVQGLTIQGAEVTLLKSPAGKWNFSSLGSKEKTEAAAPSSAGDVSVDRLRIEKSKVTIGRSGARGKTQTYEDVDISVHNLSLTSRMPFTVEAKTPGGGALKLEGEAGPLDRADAAHTPFQAEVSVEHMDLAATGFLDPTSGIAGIADYKGKAHSDGKTVEAEGKASASKLKLVRGGGPARQPITFEYASSLDLERQAGTVTKGDIHLGKSAAKLTGNYDTRGETAVVHLKLRAEGMPVSDIEGALPAVGVTLPSGSSLQGGTASATLSIDGPLDRLVISGPVNVSNTTLKGFNLGSKLGGLGALAGVHGSGSDTAIQTLASSLRIGPEGIRADGVNVVAPGLGTVTGAGTISPSNALNFRMNAKLVSGGGVAGGLSQITTLGGSQGNVPFLIQGTTSAPVFVPDVAGAVTNTVASPAGVGGILGGIFGKKKKQ